MNGLEEEKTLEPSSSEERCRGEDVPAGTGGPGSSAQTEVQSSRRTGGWLELFHEVVVPIIVVVLGVGFSVAALWVSLSTALWPAPND